MLQGNITEQFVSVWLKWEEEDPAYMLLYQAPLSQVGEAG